MDIDFNLILDSPILLLIGGIFSIGFIASLFCIDRIVSNRSSIRKYEEDSVNYQPGADSLLAKRIEDLGLHDKGEEKERGSLPQLYDLSVMSRQYEMARKSTTILKFASAILLICGIFGTLYGAHACFDGNQNIDPSKLAPALLPSMCAVGGTIILVFFSSFYQWLLNRCISELDSLTIVRLIPLKQLTKSNGFSDTLKRFTENLNRFSDDMSGIADTASSMKGCIETLNASSAEFRNSCTNIKGAFSSVEEINSTIQLTQANLTYSLHDSKNLMKQMENQFRALLIRQEQSAQSAGSITHSLDTIQSNIKNVHDAQIASHKNMIDVSNNIKLVSESFDSIKTVVEPINESVDALKKSSHDLRQFGSKIDELKHNLLSSYETISRIEQEEVKLNEFIAPISQSYAGITQSTQSLQSSLNDSVQLVNDFNVNTSNAIELVTTSAQDTMQSVEQIAKNMEQIEKTAATITQ